MFDSSIQRRLADKYPHLSNVQVQQVLDGLKDYFQLALKAEGMLSMPSQAVDEAWHGMPLFYQPKLTPVFANARSVVSCIIIQQKR